VKEQTQANRWAGRTVICLASGPSLTLEDIERVRLSGLNTIAVNTTWEKVRFCDVLYAGDNAWWRDNIKFVDIPAERWTCSKSAAQVHKIRYRQKWIKDGYNSGALAIELAAFFGASVVLMLGYDCSVKNGSHHHGDHPKTHNPTPDRCKTWEGQFRQLNKLCTETQIINCSRETALECFPRMDLESALCVHGCSLGIPSQNAGQLIREA
jgi:hypothetical protein